MVQKYKVVKRKRRKKNDHTTLTISRGVIPDVAAVQLRYVYNTNLAGTGILRTVFRGNSCFDPDFTGVGAQPMGFDQYGALFRRYRVLGSKVKVMFSLGGSLNKTAGFVVPLDTTAVVGSGISDNTEHQFTKTISIEQNQHNTINHYMSTAKLRGVLTDDVRSDSDYSAPIGGNPSLQWYWHVGAYDMNGAGGGIDSSLQVEITYYVEFFNRETLPTS